MYICCVNNLQVYFLSHIHICCEHNYKDTRICTDIETLYQKKIYMYWHIVKFAFTIPKWIQNLQYEVHHQNLNYRLKTIKL